MELENLIIDFGKESIAEIIRRTREYYVEHFIKECNISENAGYIFTHDHKRAYFYLDAFEHAFYRSVDRARKPYDKSVFDIERAKRIKWISAMVSGQVTNIECWVVPDRTRGHAKPNRLYVSWANSYVVWLRYRDCENWKFMSAYPASSKDIRRYVEQSRKIWGTKIPRD